MEEKTCPERATAVAAAAKARIGFDWANICLSLRLCFSLSHDQESDDCYLGERYRKSVTSYQGGKPST
jgi:hypothetical protein